MSETNVAGPKPGFKFWRTVGLGMTVLIAAAILLSVGRSLLDPVSFAQGIGLPLAGGAEHDPFLAVYAIRSLALCVFALVLVWRCDLGALETFVLVAVLIPLGDAALVGSEGAPLLKIARHLGTAVFLLLTYAALHAARVRSETR
jgi:hypothetical protein